MRALLDKTRKLRFTARNRMLTLHARSTTARVKAKFRSRELDQQRVRRSAPSTNKEVTLTKVVRFGSKKWLPQVNCQPSQYGSM